MSDLADCRVRFRRGDEFEDVPLRGVRSEDLRAAWPVREFRSLKGQRHYSGWYWSSTMGHHVVYESRLELARLLLADHDPRVAGIVGQPMLLQGRDGARMRRHVPDFLILGSDGSAGLVDVKPEHRLKDPNVAAQFAWTRELCGSVGWDFEVWSGADPYLVANVRFLAAYRRDSLVDHALCVEARHLVHGGERIEELEACLAGIEGDGVPGRGRASILHLLWCGDLETDLSVPLSTLSVVWPARHECVTAASARKVRLRDVW